MIVSIHQPHYHPWIGYFDKIAKSDVFVYLDNVQYKKREFQNRNKIRTLDGWGWITVPVITKGRYYQKMSNVEVDNSIDWTKSHWEIINENYKSAKHFSEHEKFFKKIYSTVWGKLIDLNLKINEYLFKAFQINTRIYFESQLDISSTSTERIIQICKKLNADEYLTGQGAKDYLDESLFEKEGIKLSWQEFTHPVYEQAYKGFEPYMSIIDLLFNKGNESVSIIQGGIG